MGDHAERAVRTGARASPDSPLRILNYSWVLFAKISDKLGWEAIR